MFEKDVVRTLIKVLGKTLGSVGLCQYASVGLWAVSKIESLARARAAHLQGFVLLVGCLQGRELGVRAAPSVVYPAGKLQWHFTCGFDFGHCLWLPFVTAFTVLKGLNYYNLFVIFFSFLFCESAWLLFNTCHLNILPLENSSSHQLINLSNSSNF